MIHDLIIIGAGPAGISAGIYAARYKLDTLLISQELGGLVGEAHLIENYPGFKSISGAELISKFKEHLEYLKVPIVQSDIGDAKKSPSPSATSSGPSGRGSLEGREADKFIFTTREGDTHEAKTVVFALGTKKRKLNIPGEQELLGKGISYCAVCDSAFFKDKIVAVVGGSDAAASAAMLLSKHAKKVYIIYRKDELRAEPAWMEKINTDSKIEIIYSTNVVEVSGKNVVEKIKLDKEHKGSKELKVEGLFIEAGSVPSTALVKQLGVEVNDSGFVKINTKCETNVPGVFAAGDGTVGLYELKQILTAAASGIVAATSANLYLKK